MTPDFLFKVQAFALMKATYDVSSGIVTNHLRNPHETI